MKSTHGLLPYLIARSLTVSLCLVCELHMAPAVTRSFKHSSLPHTAATCTVEYPVVRNQNSVCKYNNLLYVNIIQ